MIVSNRLLVSQFQHKFTLNLHLLRKASVPTTLTERFLVQRSCSSVLLEGQTLADGTDSLSRNVGNQLPSYTVQHYASTKALYVLYLRMQPIPQHLEGQGVVRYINMELEEM